MKKLLRIFSLLVVLLSVALLSSCSNKITKFEENDEFIPESDYVVNVNDEKFSKTDALFVGLYDGEKTLYLNGATVSAGKTYYKIYVEELNKALKDKTVTEVDDFVEKEIIVDNEKIIISEKITTYEYSFPKIVIEGKSYAGWFITSNYVSGTKVKSFSNLKNAEILKKAGFDEKTDINVLYLRNISKGDAAITSLVSISIVFGMLVLLCVIVTAFKYVAPKAKVQAKEAKPAAVQSAPQKAFTAADIKDEDMMVAALVASIDYREETKVNVRVVSVKQIG